MAEFILYIPEKGLTNGRGELLVPLENLHRPWDLKSESLDSADLGDLFCLLEEKKTFYHVVSELWRSLKKDAPVSLNIPHPRHDIFLSNPEYGRAILPETLEKFNAELNDKWKALGLPYPRLAHRLKIHFEMSNLQMNADPYWQDLLQKQQISSEDLNLASKQAMNVVTHMQITWVARKGHSATGKNLAEPGLTPEVLAQFRDQIEMHRKNGNNQAADLIEDMIRQMQGK